LLSVRNRFENVIDNISPTAQLSALGIHPKKSLGQNFLVDPAHRARIVAAAELSQEDVVLEIGPGLGVLTDLLAAQAGLVVAVELDDRLVPFLRARFASQPHVAIVHGDILRVDVGALMARAGETVMREEHASSGAAIHHSPGPYKVVANLPYYITAAAVQHLLEAQPPPEVVVLTVQREVAERMVARPPEMSLLALGVQYYAMPQIVERIPAGAFYPPPKVESAVVRMRRRQEVAVQGVADRTFFSVARAGFGQKRKQLRNSVAAGLHVSPAQAAQWLTAAGISPQRRAETLTIAEWGELARVVENRSPTLLLSQS
jgi:16S rRNA (adenine1518-N6/adenine1519-N6)-dimethyltransferase